MNLRLRSQDKKISVEATNALVVNKNKIVSIQSKELVFELGTYETEKRAFEVLAEIEEKIADPNCTVYQMPKE